MTATVPEVSRKHRTIERPRLYALLDGSKARVRTLVASAGYGKTTLAEQWVERDGRHGAWYTARSASTDVAALALGIARSAASIVEGCDERLREHLRALPAPAENVGVLAEILVQEGATVEVGTVIARIGEAGTSAPAEAPDAGAPPAAEAAVAPAAPAAEPAAPAEPAATKPSVSFTLVSSKRHAGQSFKVRYSTKNVRSGYKVELQRTFGTSGTFKKIASLKANTSTT